MIGDLLKIFCLSLNLGLIYSVSAQSLSTDDLLNSSFQTFQNEKYKSRSVMVLKDKSYFAKINPLSYVSIGLMFGYQRFVSQQLGSQCAFETSCSEHAKKAIEKYGLLKGTMFGFYQLQSCTPRTGEDFPEHSIILEGEVKNSIVIDKD